VFLELYHPWDLLRLMCGAFFLPHCASKIWRPRGALEFFAAAGLRPPTLFRFITIALELLCTAGLLLNVYARQAALVAAAFLLVAGVAVIKVSGGKWLWNVGGCEYAFFWMLCCLIVAIGS
jgi:putative oxidoreductase